MELYKQNRIFLDTYDEPTGINYIIIKVTEEMIKRRGSRYEATRRAWRADINRAKKADYVLSVTDKVVNEVYEIENWFRDEEFSNRIGFHGHPASLEVSNLFVGKKIPEAYCKKGCRFPFMYKKTNK